MSELSKSRQNSILADTIVSVKDFGAVGDGVTDDTVAIQTAIDAGSDLLIPPGEYTATGLTFNDNLIYGTGKLMVSGTNVIGTQGGADYGILFARDSTPATEQQFTGGFKAFTGARNDVGSAPAQHHAVALYTETQRGTGSSDGVWALNILTEVTNLDGPTIGLEIDVNNKSGTDPGLNPAQVFHALSLISGAAGRGGTAIVVDRNGDYANNQWNRGIHIKEVLQRGIEFTNCATATGIWADRTIVIKQTAATDTPVLRATPYDDNNPTVYGIYLTDAANTTIKMGILKRGTVSINNATSEATAGIAVKGIANGDNLALLQRNTDTAPTGTFVRCVNSANTVVLFDVDMNSSAAETNMKLSVAGGSALRVSVGANDSGGTGYRLLRVAN